jgi:hypothetical protein
MNNEMRIGFLGYFVRPCTDFPLAVVVVVGRLSISLSLPFGARLAQPPAADPAIRHSSSMKFCQTTSTVSICLALVVAASWMAGSAKAARGLDEPVVDSRGMMEHHLRGAALDEAQVRRYLEWYDDGTATPNDKQQQLEQ